MNEVEILGKFGFSALALVAIIGSFLLLSAYVKIVTVLHIVRTGLGFDSLPGVVVTGALALVLTFFVMSPTLERSFDAMESVSERGATDDTRARAVSASLEAWKPFLVANSGEKDRRQFAELAQPQGAAAEAIEAQMSSWRVVAPAFVVSQLRDAFRVGLRLLLPFLLIDLLVGAVFAGLALDRMNPNVVSFPLKLLLFVSVDGWGLIAANLVRSYGGG